MPGIKEITLEDARKQDKCLVELKVDGSRHTWNGKDIVSDRGIVRNDRFPHIAQELAKYDWKLVGEIAVPNSHVLFLNKKENWSKSRFYPFDILSHKGSDHSGDNPQDMRKLLDEIFVSAMKQGGFQHLRTPRKFKSFDEGWRYIKETRTSGKYAEGLVLKPLAGGTVRKIKWMVEEKLPIIGHEAGAAKGAFIVDRQGVSCKVSALSVAFIDTYQKLLAAGEKPYMEVEYLFLTDNQIMFQPRLRRLDTLVNLEAGDA